MDDMRTRVACTAPDIFTAEVVKTLLLSEGLRAMIDNESSVQTMDGAVSGNLGVHVLVPESELERAHEVIAAARRAGELAEEEA
jgi:hypothetical protein